MVCAEFGQTACRSLPNPDPDSVVSQPPVEWQSVEGLPSRHKVQKLHSWFQHSGKTSCGSLDERRNLPLFHNGENALPDPGIPLADKVPQSQPDVPRFVLHKSLFPAWTHRYPLDVFENFFR